MSRRVIFQPARLAAALAGRSDRGGLTRLEIDRAWPLPGGGVSVLYSDPATTRLWPLLRPARDEEEHRLIQAVSAGTAFRVEALDAYVLRFPRDPQLPQLAALTADREAASRRLPAALSDDNEEARLLRYKPLRRCVFRIGREAGTRFVKCLRHRKVRRLAALYRLLETVPRLSLATPDRVFDDFGALSWRPATGRTLTDGLCEDDSGDLVAATGANLAALHRSALRLPSTHGRERELRTLTSWTDLARLAHPDPSCAVSNVLARLMHRSTKLPDGPLLPAHRDFHDGQVMADGGRVTFLDFDTAAQAEAELDVGNFLAHLRLRRLERPGVPFERLASVLIDAYRASGGPPLHGERLDWYEASALLRLTCVYLFRPGGGAIADALLGCLSNRNDRGGRREVVG